VVARRYRPQAFGELVGQEHVAQALSNAINTHRVGHAYLFTGARGVGKTSSARILAKALNCVHGPTAAPCNQCDICRSISGGDDVDVLEIDGASNRGIDEIRQLRQNVNVRPSRARFKIYIIDEVHMLTREAFNALLKTLEEPPEHVKFIFCTTEANKIPITILSRCQRFDFAGISTRSIFDRLRQIVEAEGVDAEPEALEVIARRAAGSMRDSQSLLEQLLAFAPQRISVADVHGMLGTAGDQRLTAIVKHVVERNPAAALAELDGASHEGVDVGQLVEQLFGYFRDCMMAAIGCAPDTFLYASPSSGKEVVEAGKRLGLQTVLAAMQILDHTLSRMRVSTQSRTLAELALVRICHLDDLDDLSTLIALLQSGAPATPAPREPIAAPGASAARPVASAVASDGQTDSGKKNGEPLAHPPIEAPRPSPGLGHSRVERAAGDGQSTSTDHGAPAEHAAPAPGLALTAENAAEIWRRAIEKIPGMIVEQAKQFESVRTVGPNRMVVVLRSSIARATCQRPEQLAKFERALAEVTGQTVRVEFDVAEAPAAVQEPVASPRTASPHQRLLEAARHPLVRRAAELFGAQPVRVDEQ
jgi:DNA polymerase-3 subunit gamma/tau